MSDLFDLGLEDEYTEETEEQLDGDDEFSEAERRLSLARYYQQLTKGGLIDEDSEEARQVDAEVRQFARERMNVLIGIAAEKPAAAPAPELPFTERQVAVLQQWADHMIERAAQPAIRPVAPPAPVKPQPTQPRIKPVAAPPVKKKSPRPAQVHGPKKRAEQLIKPKKEESKGVDYSTIPTGEVFEENGKKYKFVESPSLDENGNPKRVKMDVTAQVRPPTAIPMPRREHMDHITAQHAADTVDASAGASTVLQAAAAISLLSE